ncbi:hypothetical protein ACFW08_20120 [Streptomyces sp. NPDC058960]|uniref:hypothetical protein n=1 Tax=Streptomyces sp. NPDC058960 TaxID=3346679 RepID=UPI0036CD3898
MTTPKPRWKSLIRWDDNDRTTHNGRTYQLETHSYSTGKGGWSETDDYHVHEVTGSGQSDPRPLHGPLGTNRRRAMRLAELLLLGWTRGMAMDREPGTGRDRWRAPDGELHPIEDVLTGRIPH